MLLSRQARQFIEVVRQRSFVRAAEKICITASALNHGINELESKIGVKLVNRRHSGVTLTQAGARLYAQIAPFCEREKAIVQNVKFYQDKMLVVNVDECYYPQVSDKVNHIMSEYGVNLSFIRSKGVLITKEALSGECDFIISTSLGVCSGVPDDICRISLASERVGIVATRELLARYPLAGDMLRRDLMIQTSAFLQHPMFDKLLARVGLSDGSVATIGLPDMFDVYRALSGGLGYSFATEQELNTLCALTPGSHLLYHPLKEDLFINRYIYFEKNRYDDLIDIAMRLCQ